MHYRIKTIGKLCAATGEALTPGTTCHSVLVEADGECRRLDFSEAAWNGPPEGAIGHWRCVVPDPTDGRPQPLDVESLFHFFEDLGEDGNPVQEQFRYVAALLLLQRRRLRLEDSRDEDGVTWLELVGSHGEGPFTLRDQKLDPDEIQALEHELSRQLQADD